MFSVFAILHPPDDVLHSTMAMWSLALLLAVAQSATAATSASEPAESTIEPTQASIYATAATASALAPVSNVKGLAFDRFYQIWLENTVGAHCRSPSAVPVTDDV